MKKTVILAAAVAPIAAVSTWGALATAAMIPAFSIMLALCALAGWLLTLDFASGAPVLRTFRDWRRSRRNRTVRFGGGRGLGIMDNL